jgi:DNA (cytosine-5)-methyltransferase 1
MAYAESKHRRNINENTPNGKRWESREESTKNSFNRRTGTAITAFPPITLLTGGFPCQPFSVAGKQAGKGDDRYLWPEMFRVIQEVRPTWVVAENVTGIIKLALDDCLSNLESAGYETEVFVIPACAVNAPHRRDRVWIVAYNSQLFSRTRKESTEQGIETTNGSQDVPDTRLLRQTFNEQQATGVEQYNWWTTEPDVGRVANGIPRRVDRLKALGNAIVPQVAHRILSAIAEIELTTVKEK